MTDRWPSIPCPEWRETCTAVHPWSQIVVNYRLAHTPSVNHSWHATLYVTPRGPTTGPAPDLGALVTVACYFCDQKLVVEAEGGARETFPLQSMSAAEFFARTKAAMRAVGGRPTIRGAPNEFADPVPFRQDEAERPYDPDAVRRSMRPWSASPGYSSSSEPPSWARCPPSISSEAPPPGGHPLLRPDRPAAPGRNAEPAGQRLA